MHITQLNIPGYERVAKCEDPASGLLAFIAVHDTTLGPAVGGTRLYPYANEQDALTDALRLAKGMTYKSALAGNRFGGGKSVIVATRKQKTPELLRAFGHFVESFGGTYVCAEDMNTTTADMETIRTVTAHVAGLSSAGGDPSPITALGVFSAIEATALYKLQLPMNQLHVAVQGVGAVGTYLVQRLAAAGCKITISDVNTEKLSALEAAYGCHSVPVENILTTSCDILAPCAMGAVLNETSIPRLNCKAVVGAANNQLATDEDDNRLQQRGILYGPDYLVNAGGIINVHIERLPGGYNRAAAEQAARDIGKTLLEVYKIAEQQGVTTAEAADKLAEARIARNRARNAAAS